MSGPDTPETPEAVPPDLPEEFAATYAEAYRRALESGEYDELNTGIQPVVVDPESVPPPVVAPAGPDPFDTRPAATVPERPTWLVPAFVAALAVVLVAGAYGVGKAVSGDSDDPAGPVLTAPDSSAPATATKEPRPGPGATPSDLPTSTAEVWEGDVDGVTPDGARATCRAPASTDASGVTVRYRAPNTLDGEPATAWRCNGEAIGESLRFEFDDSIEIGQVGLIPGYAKTDPASGADRFTENNRITRVRWILGDGVVVEQNLDPDDRSVQSVRVPRTETDRIVVEILAVDQGPRNTTAISEVEFAQVDD